jgi:hypothetical protein
MNRLLAIMGIAQCLEDDLANLPEYEPYDYMAIGVDCSDRIMFDIHHAATYHPREFDEFHIRRKKIGGNLDYYTHSHDKPADYVWPLVGHTPYSGSSSFLGAQAAVGLGYQKIILCGCPMTGANENPNKKTVYNIFQKGWVRHAPTVLQGKVRSMCGWTAEFLGYPDEDWLNEL